MKKYLKGLVASIVAMFAFIPFVSAATHIVNFDAMGGTPSTISPIEGEDGGSFLLPNVTKEGYTLQYWYYIDDSCPEESPCHYAPIDGNEFKSYWPSEITLYAKWATVVNTININVDLPVGSQISFPDNALPESAVTVPSGSKYGAYPEGAGLIKAYDDDSPFSGTIEKGKDYYVELIVMPNEAIFAADTVIKVNGKDTFVVNENYLDANGKLNEYAQRSGILMYAKVTAGETSTTEETTSTTTTGSETATTGSTDAKKFEVLEGANQQFDATGKDKLRFRFNIDYALFKKSGKVFVDGAEVKKYNSEEGSTIIVFTKAFTNKLKAGNHTVKVTTDEGEVETSFTVTKAVKNPQTGDNIMTYVALAIISGLSLVYVTKKRFN